MKKGSPWGKRGAGEIYRVVFPSFLSAGLSFLGPGGGDPGQSFGQFNLLLQISFAEDHHPLGLGGAGAVHGLHRGSAAGHGLNQ
jgi:hypothetical protein